MSDLRILGVFSMKKRSRPEGAVLWLVAVLICVISSQTTALWSGGQEAAVVPEVETVKYWKDVNGEPLPFVDESGMLDFLRSAHVLSMKSVPLGVTNPRQIVLEKDGIKARAIFRDVDIYKRQYRDPDNRARFHFRDYCVFECAAYELSRLLGLSSVPPVVRRKVHGKTGTVQIWMEGTMMELDRQKEELVPQGLDLWRWNMQHQIMWIFDSLISNEDRNQGNILIDKEWNIWMVDHTRAFRLHTEMDKLDKVLYCDRSLWAKLNSLTKKELVENLSDYLRPNEITAILKRRDIIVKHLQKRIDKEGESSVFFTLPRLK
jgi:hypothetical protein